jgi:predicted MarR family transcription regulator
MDKPARKAGRAAPGAPAAPPHHLGGSALEATLFEFQHGALCFIEAFHRHISSQLDSVAGASFSAQDCVILHAVRLGERPKSIPDIQHFTNRSDLANIQYSVRKLVQAGLVERASGQAARGASYRVTPRGREVTDLYVQARREAIARIVADPDALVDDLRTATRAMLLLTATYDHAARTRGIGQREPLAPAPAPAPETATSPAPRSVAEPRSAAARPAARKPAQAPR